MDPGWTPDGPQMDPRWNLDGPQMDPRWTPDGPRMTPDGPWMDPRGVVKMKYQGGTSNKIHLPAQKIKYFKWNFRHDPPPYI